MVIKRLGVLSVGKVLGMLYALLGLLFGALFSLLSLGGVMAGLATEGADGAEALIGMFFGLGAVIVLPVFYGLMGFLMGLLTAFLYNVVAGLAGGIELDVG